MKHRILQQLERVPAARMALQDDARTFSFADLNRCWRQEAKWQSEFAGQRTALLADNGSAWIITDLAMLARQAVAVPLPAYFTNEQLAHALDDCATSHVLTDTPDRILSLSPEWLVQARSPVTGLVLLHRPEQSCGTLPAGTAKVTYTSGSTAEPKGVCLTSDAIDRVVRSVAVTLSSLRSDKHLSVLPLATLLENIAGVYAALTLGAMCAVPSTSSIGVSYGSLDAARLVHAISQWRPETLILVPELLRVLVAATERGWMPPDSLKFIAVGGAIVSASLLEQAASAGLPVYEGYGLSECASVVCLNTPEHCRRGSVGRPLPHARVTLGVDGQIYVSGAVMSGYLGDGLHANPPIATGDLGEIDEDGFVYIRGRKKNLFISSMGRNVSPEWIECELMRDEGVRQAVVFGEGRMHPIAILSPSTIDISDQALSAAVSRANRYLPDYAQVREWVRVHEPIDFQSGLLTANGRPRRDRIAERFKQFLGEHAGARVS